MSYRLASERVTLEADGPSVEVERIASWAVQQLAARYAGAFNAASPDTKLPRLRDLYAFFVEEAQPTWDLIDHRGPVLPDVSGLLRLPLAFGLALVEGWAGTLPPDEPAGTAADAVLPPGPLRDGVNAGLKAARRKKG